MRRAVSVADPVEPGQVGTGLGGGDDVVDRDGVLRQGEGDSFCCGACSLKGCDPFADLRSDPGSSPS
jgi:hypothetical protein